MKLDLAAELAKLEARRPGADFTAPFRQAEVRLVLFAPRGRDTQQPHTQDEIYIVVTGSGTLVIEEEAIVFGPGDALFVPANKVHRFVDFTDDLVTWAFFWGPPGGGAATPRPG